jgi:hypothetical protein
MLDGLGGLACGPAPLLLLVGRAMQPMLDGATEMADVQAVFAQAAERIRL